MGGHPWVEPSPSAGAVQGGPNLALASKGTWGWENTVPTYYRKRQKGLSRPLIYSWDGALHEETFTCEVD